ncbi:myb-like protein I [Aplysia californica]|uniref:Myb-like protein I n=1 Tax=Aplysia californica TaxID=6500 RepID=A0ABM0JTC6_APLCA|nr:myb-like protein I [Aplysia californica]
MSDEKSEGSMSYLFYVGIIIPTIITIVLFGVFIYCWFLQRARKEVLTKKYDPHGKMRRLGMSLEPPPPPAYCRIDDCSSGSSSLGVGGGGGILSLGGADNEAYDVSRSPSTEQEARGRPLYHTYHDSGISAGLAACGGLSPSQEGEPRPGGFAYRSCPDSGISGFSVSHTCRGCGQAAAVGQLPSPQQQQQQQLQHLHLGNEIQLHYEEQPQDMYHLQEQQQQQQQLHYDPNHFQQLSPQQQYHPQHQHQQQEHLPQVMLHQNLMPASVHPTHGVCYGDNMTHPQSPQHYNPPPVHPASLNLPLPPPRAGYDDRLNSFHQDSSPPPGASSAVASSSSTMQIRRDLSAAPRRQSPERAAPAGSVHHVMHPNDIQLQHELNSAAPSYNQGGGHIQENVSTLSPGRDGIATTYHFPNDHTAGGGLPIPSTSATHNFHSQNAPPPPPPPLQDRHYGHDPAAMSHPQTPSSPSKMATHSYRDSGVSDVGRSAQPGSASTSAAANDRPDSQASQSSTTDSEDSGFRSSHCAAHHNSQLSKHGNPLLKPLRRTRNHNGNGGNSNNARSGGKSTHRAARSNKSGGSGGGNGSGSGGNNSSNSDDSSSSAHGARPLITLNPQNLPHAMLDGPDVIATTTSLLHNNNNPDFVTTHSRNPTSRGSNQNPGAMMDHPDSAPRTSPGSSRAGLVLTSNNSKSSPVHSSNMNNTNNATTTNNSNNHHQHSPHRDNWPPSQSLNDQETMVKQSIDMADISTHLSWKYLQDISVSSSSSSSAPTKSSPGGGGGGGGPMMALQSCHQGLAPGANGDQPGMEVFGFSVV